MGEEHRYAGPHYFTAEEARALLGRRYRATADYSGVPAGTAGVVSGYYRNGSGPRSFGVDVTWQGISCGSPLGMERGGRTDGFSRLDLYTVFVAGAEVGKRAMVPLDGPDDGPLGSADSPAMTLASNPAGG